MRIFSSPEKVKLRPMDLHKMNFGLFVCMCVHVGVLCENINDIITENAEFCCVFYCCNVTN